MTVPLPAHLVEPLSFLESLPIDYDVHEEPDLLDLLFTLGYNPETPYMRTVRSCFSARLHTHKTGEAF